MSSIEVEVYSLSDMRTSLRKLQEAADSALFSATGAICKEQERLRQIKARRDNELASAQCAYDACLACVDEDGNRPSCSAEAAAVQEGQRRVAEAQACIDQFESDVTAYRRTAAQRGDSLREATADARRYLLEHSEAGLQYLAVHPNELGNVPGAGTHGSLYGSARREWFRQGAAGELWDTEGTHLQGWMRQEVNRGGYYGSAPMMDTGHRIAGIDIPENFRWEDASINRARSGLGRTYGVATTRL